MPYRPFSLLGKAPLGFHTKYLLLGGNIILKRAHFLKAPEIYRAHKAIFSSSVSKNGEVYTVQTSCMKRTSVHIKKNVNKTALYHKGPDFAKTLIQMVFRTFEIWAPGQKTYHFSDISYISF